MRLNWSWEGVPSDVFLQSVFEYIIYIIYIVYCISYIQTYNAYIWEWIGLEKVSRQMCSYKLVPGGQSHLSLLHQNVRFFVLKSLGKFSWFLCKHILWFAFFLLSVIDMYEYMKDAIWLSPPMINHLDLLLMRIVLIFCVVNSKYAENLWEYSHYWETLKCFRKCV